MIIKNELKRCLDKKKLIISFYVLTEMLTCDLVKFIDFVTYNSQAHQG
jgi:hypothetical protein